MIERSGDRLLVTASLTMDHARSLLEAGCAALQEGEQVFDFSAVSEADSSAIVVMLGWLRAAGAARAEVRFVNIPAGVTSLAELYGVSELLPLA